MWKNQLSVKFFKKNANILRKGDSIQAQILNPLFLSFHLILASFRFIYHLLYGFALYLHLKSLINFSRLWCRSLFFFILHALVCCNLIILCTLLPSVIYVVHFTLGLLHMTKDLPWNTLIFLNCITSTV